MIMALKKMLYGTKKGEIEIIQSTPQPREAADGISEPVISFLKTVRKNPKRFSATEDHASIKRPWDERNKITWRTLTTFAITDLVTAEKWEVQMEGCSMTFFQRISKKPEFLSDKEVFHLVEEIRTIYNQRDFQYRKLKIKRAERGHAKERERLTQIYQQGE